MSKRDFIKALARGDLHEAQRIKEVLNSKSNYENFVIVHYPVPMANNPSGEQKRAFDKFCRKAERENPNKSIVYIKVMERKP